MLAAMGWYLAWATRLLAMPSSIARETQLRVGGHGMFGGQDGREALRMIFAAYESARTGQRIDFPYDPPAWARRPVHCWKPWLSPSCPEELRAEGE